MKKLLLLPLFLGLILMVYSWYLSYPLSVDSANDYVFNHVPVSYWVSLPLLFTSMYLIAATSRSHTLRALISVGFVMALYSLYYFCYALPGPDAHFFRGLTQNFITTGNLDSSSPVRGYYQFPSFFILASIVTSLSGLKLENFEFLQFTIIGFLLATTLYVYASKGHKQGGFLVPLVFFISMFFFLNYQNAPFSLALGLVFVLYMLETCEKNFGVTLTSLVLFMSISLTHAFVPLFFIIYLLIQSIAKRDKRYAIFFLLTSITYLIVQINIATESFIVGVLLFSGYTPEYSNLVGLALAPVSIPLDVLAQVFSRLVTIGFIGICFSGFVYLLAKRKLRDSDKAVLLTGVIWSGAGTIFSTMGSRAIPIIFIPISLGAACLFERKFRPYLTGIFLILLSLVAFIPLHVTFSDPPIMFQTEEAQTTAKFLIGKYNWNASSTILSDSQMQWYISPQIEGSHENDFTSTIRSSSISTYNCVIYSVVLARSFQNSNTSAEQVFQQIQDRFNKVYDSGFFYIALNSRPT